MRGATTKHAVFMAGLVLLLLISVGAQAADIPISELDFQSADIRHIMKTLSEIGGRNIVLDKTIEGDCSIYLKDVTWKEAFVAVLRMNDLVGIEDRGFVKVLPRAAYEQQQEALREELNKRRLEERLGETVSVHVMKIDNARAEDVKRTLDPLLGEADRPSVDLRTNSLVFTVTDSSLAVIQDIVQELDTETRQVNIRVKMVTIDAGSVAELGINWNAIKDGNQITQYTTAEDDKLLVGSYAGTVSGATINAVLATMIDKNKANVISQPQVTTQDNEPAMISSGQQVPIITYDEARNSVINLQPAITSLIVTPHILADDRILLDVEATRSTAEGVGIGLKINEEKAQVKMIVTDGETAVIGGMQQQQESNHDMGIPILQDIPLIGQLFKYSKTDYKQTDLHIFITPNIISELKPEDIGS